MQIDHPRQEVTDRGLGGRVESTKVLISLFQYLTIIIGKFSLDTLGGDYNENAHNLLKTSKLVMSLSIYL
jgi:hypothetical protein